MAINIHTGIKLQNRFDGMKDSYDFSFKKKKPTFESFNKITSNIKIIN